MAIPLHRAFLLFVGFSCTLLYSTSSISQEKPENGGGETKISLQVGDKAPQLNVDHWLGGAVESFSKGNVYVVEFWATWCGPCVKSMPHLSELADRYAKQGMIVAAVTQTDESNTREAIEEFIKGPGNKFPFHYAICENNATHRAYMEAAGQNSIPCSFVVDGEGKVAYIGHPHDLDYVLERITAGKWRGKEDAEELREMNDSIAKLGALVQSDPDKALQIVEHIRRVNPQRANSIDFAYAEVMVLCKKKMFDRAKEAIESSAKDSSKTVEWGAIAMQSGLLASSELNPEGKHLDFAIGKIHEAEEALKDDWQNLLQVGIAYQLSGDKVKWKQCMDRVVQLCPDELMKKSLRLAIELQMKTSGQ